MIFNSFEFLIFFPIVILIYMLIPRKMRYLWLLVASYYFYMCWNPKYALLIATSTVITWFSGIMLEWTKERPIYIKKCIVFVSFASNLAILIIFKYLDFIRDNLNRILAFCRIEVISNPWDLLLPVGISFYTFQALSYTMDVYRGEIVAEKNPLKYALFVSFFPQLVAGPIERSANLISQIEKLDTFSLWNGRRIRDGLLWMLWGFFQKIVIADRIALFVTEVYDAYHSYGFLEIALATILFAFQIYCDFDGYTNIAIGAAKVMGISLMKNFKQPYLAGSIKDFWRRWHISLTSWFTDYLYIPLGGSRIGTIRKYINIGIVFFISGLWHGASWNYITWGCLHAVYQIVEDVFRKAKEKKGKKLRQNVLVTFVLVDFAWIFFRSSSASGAINTIRQLFTTFSTTSLFEIGMTRGDWLILAIALCILFVKDMLCEKGISIMEWINRQKEWIRLALYIGAVWFLILFGIYGVAYDASQFIYFQF